MTTTWPDGSARRAAGMAMLAAPVFVLVYGVIRLLDSGHGPGGLWTTSHLLFLVGLALFVLVVAELRRQARTAGWRALATDLTAIVAWLGLLASLVQVFLDLVVGLQSTSRAAMTAAFHRVQAIPGVELAVYLAGPVLFYVALVAFAVLLTARTDRRIAVVSAALIGAGAVLPGISLDLIPVAAGCLLAGLAPLGVRLLRSEVATPATPRAALR
ncbi:hypothetical protein [Fodinicola acaciae]|uniref:hypothetical protein n=1 Tax=Fodinicola acaciae TaxID=2681555 RepID=UPI0013D3DCD8|nr:hypothetical protein [Fodinicola acaciae]